MLKGIARVSDDVVPVYSASLSCPVPSSSSDEEKGQRWKLQGDEKGAFP